MKRFLFSIALLFTALAGCSNHEGESAAPKSELNVMSYNIRYANASDKGDAAWDARKEASVTMIRDVKPDVIGMQEPRFSQAQYLIGELTEYEHYYLAPDDKDSQHRNAVWWRKDRFEMLAQGYFFLNEKDITQPIKGWGHNQFRTALWVKLRERSTGKEFFFFNTPPAHRPTDGNDSIAEEFGSVIDAYNQDRKSIDRSVTQEAHDYIEGNPEMKALKSTVIYNPRWMKGIVGIVASRLIETYYRPTVVLTMSNGFVTGSARSVPGFDLYQAVESCSDLLENFGGHMYAAGLTMRPENVGEFTRRFNAYVEENIDPQMLVPQVDIDSELLFSDITPAFRKDLNRFQPFGPGNTAPVFATCGVSNHGDAKLVGMECEHLRMDLMQRQKPNTKIQAIAFQQPTHYEWVRSGRPIDVCYQIVENHYRGTVTTQLRIKDIKPVLNR